MPMIAFLSELKRNHNKLTDKLIELKLGGGGGEYRCAANSELNHSGMVRECKLARTPLDRLWMKCPKQFPSPCISMPEQEQLQ